MSDYDWDWSSAMSKLQLSQDLDTEHYKAFSLSKPNTRCGSMRVVFTPEGIVILGDLVPLRNGVVSDFGYGLDWFSSHLYGDYLCSKFLCEEFVPEIALANLKDHLEHADDYGYSAENVLDVQELIERLEGGELSEFEFNDTMYKIDPDFVIDGCGRGYNLRNASLLCAIQKRFAELYAELEA